MPPVQCFLLEPTVKFKRNLRRFTFSGKSPVPCESKYGHDATAYTQDVVELPRCVWAGTGCEPHSRDDERWPKTCARCGYVFLEEDEWQHNLERVWRRVDTGEEMTTREAPAGALWLFDKEIAFRVGPDGRELHVKLPDGTDWNVDMIACNSDKPWDRTGVPPVVTARPSILTNGYHGYLTDGVLTEC